MQCMLGGAGVVVVARAEEEVLDLPVCTRDRRDDEPPGVPKRMRHPLLEHEKRLGIGERHLVHKRRKQPPVISQERLQTAARRLDPAFDLLDLARRANRRHKRTRPELGGRSCDDPERSVYERHYWLVRVGVVHGAPCCARFGDSGSSKMLARPGGAGYESPFEILSGL